MKGMMWFGKKGKLSPRYLGLHQILQRLGNVPYRLNIPQDMNFVHPEFHVSMLKKCLGDPNFILRVEGLEVMRTFLAKRF